MFTQPGENEEREKQMLRSKYGIEIPPVTGKQVLGLVISLLAVGLFFYLIFR